MTTIYLCRHGQSDGNRYRQFDGQYNAPLTGLGKKQAAALAERFRPIDLAAVFSSDQQRAYFTAQGIAMSKGLTVQPLRELRELHNGIWEHLMWADIDRKWPGQLELFDHHMDRWQIPGAEAPMDVAERYIGTIKRLAARYDGQAIALVGHGDALRITMGVLHGLTLDKFGQDGRYGTNTAVTKLEWEDNNARIIYEYDASHLSAALTAVTTAESGMGLSYELLSPFDNFPIGGLTVPTDREVGTWLGGYCGGVPASLLQMLPSRKAEPGQIGFYFLAPAFRGKHLGIQPMGQAVDFYRKCGVRSLRMRLVTDEMRAYFPKFDFIHVKGDVWELPISPVCSLDQCKCVIPI